MQHPSKRPDPSADSAVLTLLAERPQLDFELDFYGQLLQRVPDFADALRAQASNLTTKGLLSSLLDTFHYMVLEPVGEGVNNAIKPVLQDLIDNLAKLEPKMKEIGAGLGRAGSAGPRGMLPK